jgi:DNA-binding transcriptional ArsR family regulator
MPHTPDLREGERLDPAEAFGIMGNETRLKILQVLVDEGYGPMTFSALRKRVGMRDGSQFNYHLKKLEGPFIRKTDEGYEVRHAGVHVIRTIVRGSFTDHPRIPPFNAGGVCVVCAEPLLAEYKHEMVFVGCSSCGRRHVMGMFPPAAVVGRTDEEMLAAFDRWQHHDFALSRHGVSPMCGGRTTGTVVRDPEDVFPDFRGIEPTDFMQFDLGMKYQCEQCDTWDYGTPGKHLLTHPAVVGFHLDHGIGLETVPHWELDWVVTNERTTVLAEDPLRVQVTIPLDDEELRVTLDETFAARDIERTPVES